MDMDLDKALSLAAFINSQSTRFHAEVLQFNRKGWVIIADNRIPKNSERRTHPEPITNPEDYVRRASVGALQIDEEVRRLVEYWIALSPVIAQ